MGTEALKELLSSIKSQADADLLSETVLLDEVTVEVAPSAIVGFVTLLRDRFDFVSIVDVCGVDPALFGG